MSLAHCAHAWNEEDGGKRNSAEEKQGTKNQCHFALLMLTNQLVLLKERSWPRLHAKLL